MFQASISGLQNLEISQQEFLLVKETNFCGTNKEENEPNPIIGSR